MLFEDKTEERQPSFGEMKTLLLRAREADWEDLGILRADADPRLAIDWPAEAMARTAEGFQDLKVRLGASFEGAQAGDPDALLLALPWLRQTGLGLEAAPALAARCEVQGDRLLGGVEQTLLLQTLGTHAGQAKDGAMDARALLGGFGWHLVSRVLGALREEVGRLPDAAAEALLRPFAPMLVLVAKMMAERAAGTDENKGKVDALHAEVQEAQEDKDDAEAALQLRGEPKLPRTQLVEMARRDEPPPPPRRKSRR